VTVEIRSSEKSIPWSLGQMALGFPHAHPARRHRHDLVVEAREATLVALDELRIERSILVARNANVATAHGWGRAISGLGHDLRLVTPIYVKPFVRRQKNDAADAEAIAEAASRPTRRFMELKTEEQQARSMIFRTRDLLVRQRTQLVNALRGHLAEHGIVAAHGLTKVKVLATELRDTGSLHPLVCELGQRYLDHIARLDVEIAEPRQEIAATLQGR
jgi:transposase